LIFTITLIIFGYNNSKLHQLKPNQVPKVQ